MIVCMYYSTIGIAVKGGGAEVKVLKIDRALAGGF